MIASLQGPSLVTLLRTPIANEIKKINRDVRAQVVPVRWRLTTRKLGKTTLGRGIRWSLSSRRRGHSLLPIAVWFRALNRSLLLGQRVGAVRTYMATRYINEVPSRFVGLTARTKPKCGESNLTVHLESTPIVPSSLVNDRTSGRHALGMGRCGNSHKRAARTARLCVFHHCLRGLWRLQGQQQQ